MSDEYDRKQKAIEKTADLLAKHTKIKPEDARRQMAKEQRERDRKGQN